MWCYPIKTRRNSRQRQHYNPIMSLIRKISSTASMRSKGPALEPPSRNATALEVVQRLDLTGKNVFITGANSGIGFETARALSLQGAHVILACRSVARASEARDAILDEREDASVSIEQLDLEDLESVEHCAARLNEAGRPIHVVILNAGVYNPLHRVTDNGFEATFQINHLAQFYLIQLMMPLLIRSAPSRVIVVSSSAHAAPNVANLKANDIKWELFSPTHKHGLNKPMKAYGISKLANVLFARELDRRYAGQSVTACSLHPGIIKTQITRNSKTLEALVMFAKPFTINAAQGAATSVYLATVPDLADFGGGAYFEQCRVRQAAPSARNTASAVKLWELSEEMLDHYKTGDVSRDIQTNEEIDDDNESQDVTNKEPGLTVDINED